MLEVSGGAALAGDERFSLL